VQKIRNADRNREAEQAKPPLRQVRGDRHRARVAQLVQQVACSFVLNHAAWNT